MNRKNDGDDNGDGDDDNDNYDDILFICAAFINEFLENNMRRI